MFTAAISDLILKCLFRFMTTVYTVFDAEKMKVGFGQHHKEIHHTVPHAHDGL